LLAADDYRAVWDRAIHVGAVALLVACAFVSACGSDDVTAPDGDDHPLPDAKVVEVRLPTFLPGMLVWGKKIHVIFDRDPGPVRFEPGLYIASDEIAGSGALRAFIVTNPPPALLWGKAGRHEFEYEGIGVPDPPSLLQAAPDPFDGPLKAADLNTDGLRLVFDAVIDNSDRLIPLWEFTQASVNREDGAVWTPEITISGQTVTVLPAEGEAFRAQHDYMVVGLLADRFTGGQATYVDVPVSVE